MTLLVEPPPQTTPAAFAAELSLDAIAQQVKTELPNAELTITGPELLVAGAVFDPLQLSTKDDRALLLEAVPNKVDRY